MCPAAQSNGHNGPWLVEELFPGEAAQGDDLVVGLEDAIGQPVLADELPDILDRIELRGARRQGEDSDIGRNDQFVGGVPSRLIHHEYGMGAGRYLGGDFLQVPLHGLGIAAGQDEGGTDASLGTDGAEDVDRLGALVLERDGTRAASSPASRDLVLLSDPGFVLPPDLYVGSWRQGGPDFCQRG